MKYFLRKIQMSSHSNQMLGRRESLSQQQTEENFLQIIQPKIVRSYKKNQLNHNKCNREINHSLLLKWEDCNNHKWKPNNSVQLLQPLQQLWAKTSSLSRMVSQIKYLRKMIMIQMKNLSSMLMWILERTKLELLYIKDPIQRKLH